MKPISQNPNNQLGTDKLGKPHWVQTSIPVTEKKVPSIYDLNYHDWVQHIGKEPTRKIHFEDYLKHHGLTVKDVEDAIKKHQHAQNYSLFDDTEQTDDHTKYVIRKVKDYHNNPTLSKYFQKATDYHNANKHEIYSNIVSGKELKKSLSNDIFASALGFGSTKINPKTNHLLTLAPVQDGTVKRWQLFNDELQQDKYSRLERYNTTQISKKLIREPHPELIFLGFLNNRTIDCLALDVLDDVSGVHHYNIMIERGIKDNYNTAVDLVQFIIKHFNPNDNEISISTTKEFDNKKSNKPIDLWNALRNSAVCTYLADHLYTENELDDLKNIQINNFDYSDEDTGYSKRIHGEPYVIVYANDGQTPILFPGKNIKPLQFISDMQRDIKIHKLDDLPINGRYGYFDEGLLYNCREDLAKTLVDLGKVKSLKPKQEFLKEVQESINNRPIFSQLYKKDSAIPEKLKAYNIKIETNGEISSVVKNILRSIVPTIEGFFNESTIQHIMNHGVIIRFPQNIYNLEPADIQATYHPDHYEDYDPDSGKSEMKTDHIISMIRGEMLHFSHEFVHYLDFSGWFDENSTREAYHDFVNFLLNSKSIQMINNEHVAKAYKSENAINYLKTPTEIIARFIEQLIAYVDPQSPLSEPFDTYSRNSNVGYWSHDDFVKILGSDEFKKFGEATKWKSFTEFMKSLIESWDEYKREQSNILNDRQSDGNSFTDILLKSWYKIKNRTFAGLPIGIENKKGTFREGTDKDGHHWKVKMYHDYGYIRRTLGVDSDQLDVYLGPNEDDFKDVYVIHQNDPVTGKYDEDKVMLGFDSPESAKNAYLQQYDRPGFFGSMEIIEREKFEDMVKRRVYRGKPMTVAVELKKSFDDDDIVELFLGMNKSLSHQDGETKPSGDHFLTFKNHRWHSHDHESANPRMEKAIEKLKSVKKQIPTIPEREKPNKVTPEKVYEDQLAEAEKAVKQYEKPLISKDEIKNTIPPTEFKMFDKDYSRTNAQEEDGNRFIVHDGKRFDFLKKSASGANHYYKRDLTSDEIEEQAKALHEEKIKGNETAKKYTSDRLNELKTNGITKNHHRLALEANSKNQNDLEDEIHYKFSPFSKTIDTLVNKLHELIGGDIIKSQTTKTRYIDLDGVKIRLSEHDSRSEQDADDVTGKNFAQYRPKEYQPEDINIVFGRGRGNIVTLRINNKTYKISDHAINNHLDLAHFIVNKLPDNLVENEGKYSEIEEK